VEGRLEREEEEGQDACYKREDILVEERESL